MKELSNIDWFDDTKKYGSKPGLEIVKKLLELLGDPQYKFESVQITGTNGKGSTTAMTTSILRQAGYRVGMFTSPHLSRINESIQVNNQEISTYVMEEYLGEIMKKVSVLLSQGFRHPTQFELLVTMAFMYFSDMKIQIAVVEVGMGGRDDATNVLDNKISIITNVSLEHTQWLGGTIEDIAENKAGILRDNSVLITAATQPKILSILESEAHRKQSKFINVNSEQKIILESYSLERQKFTVQTTHRKYEHLTLPLLGDHQLLNAACSLSAIEEIEKYGFKVDYMDIRTGIANVVWPGRFEIIEKEPLIILDGAKDAEAMKALVATIKKYIPNRKIITILGISSDKNLESMINSLVDITNRFIITVHRVADRTAKASELENIAIKTEVPTEIIIPVRKAIEEARNNLARNEALLITGSVFLIGEARETWKSLVK